MVLGEILVEHQMNQGVHMKDCSVCSLVDFRCISIRYDETNLNVLQKYTAS